jgi:vancomycin permeability regulator SanA
MKGILTIRYKDNKIDAEQEIYKDAKWAYLILGGDNIVYVHKLRPEMSGKMEELIDLVWHNK